MSLPVVGTLCVCERCKREMLVEQFLIGVSHTANIMVACWSCLTPKQQAEARVRYGIGAAPKTPEAPADHTQNPPHAEPVERATLHAGRHEERNFLKGLRIRD